MYSSLLHKLLRSTCGCESYRRCTFRTSDL